MQNQTSAADFSNVNIEKIDKNDLVDLKEIPFDNTIPQEQRAAYIFQMIKNPYCFRVGNIGVKLEFTENAPTIQTLLTDVLIREKSSL